MDRRLRFAVVDGILTVRRRLLLVVQLFAVFQPELLVLNFFVEYIIKSVDFLSN